MFWENKAENLTHFDEKDAIINCDGGYEISNGVENTTLRCNETGQWSERPVCVPKGNLSRDNYLLSSVIL